MNIPVTAASEYILHFLGIRKQGFVHSVYRKTINLSFDGQLVALQAAGSPLSPISLLTPLTGGEMAALPVNAGMPAATGMSAAGMPAADGMSVSADGMSVSAGMSAATAPGALQVGENLTFLFDRVSPVNLQLTGSLPVEKRILLRERLHDLLASRSAGSFELLFSDPGRAAEIPFLAVTKEHLACASHALASSCWEEAAGRLGRMIGLGPGLTPAGDDFLCGVLAGLILCGSGEHPFSLALREYIDRHLEDTNAISAAFLQCALKGQFSHAVNSLLLLPSREEIFDAFTAIGHSSGTDTLCGITYLLDLNSDFHDDPRTPDRRC